MKATCPHCRHHTEVKDAAMYAPKATGEVRCQNCRTAFAIVSTASGFATVGNNSDEGK